MQELNNTTCTALYDSVEWFNSRNVIILTILTIINIIILVGNTLVVLAVCCTSKLRNVMNVFVVNLAIADLMVSLTVLPFSALWEVYKVWIFGKVWCSIWLAIDVWTCTASILNLCVISLDRYLAVTKPFNYPQLMSSNRTKLLLAGIWILSFFICFPPLVGWKDKQVPNNDMNPGPFNTTTILVTMKPCPWVCQLNNNPGYVIYSALGSFFIPMFVMIFFYWKIYKVATSATKAINQGFQKTSRTNGQGITLRMHCGRGRGRGRNRNRDNDRNNSNNSNSKSSDSSSIKQEKPQIPNVIPTIEIVNEKFNNLERTPSRRSQVSVNYNNGQTHSELYLTPQNLNVKVETINDINNDKRQKSCESHDGGDKLSLHEMASPGKRKVEKLTHNLKNHMKKLRIETKAAKTLGIIVGCFIVCWLPFFTVYLIRPFFPNFINPTFFSVLFWLGYCNSMVNPIIYSLCNKDFRNAFKKILCGRCSFMKRIKKKSRHGNNTNQLLMRNDRHPNCSNRVVEQKNVKSDPELELKATNSHSESK